MPRSRTVRAFAAACGGALLLLLTACPGADAPPRGALRIDVTGLPEGAPARIAVSGPGDYAETVTGSVLLEDLALGSYDVVAQDVDADGAAYAATVEGSPAGVTDGGVAEVAVAYEVAAAPNERPDIGSFTAVPSPAEARSEVEFTWIATDPEGAELACTLDFGDGESATVTDCGANRTATHAFASGTHEVRLVATDPAGGEDVQTLVLEVRPAAGEAVQIGTADYDIYNGAAVGDDGSVFVAGSTDGDLVRANSGTEGLLARFDAQGREVWIRQIGSHETVVSALALGPDGDLYVAGHTTTTLADTHRGQADLFVARYTPGGTEQWIRQLGTTESDQATELAVGADGSVYLSGTTWGDMAAPPAGNSDVFLMQLDPDGAPMWTRQLGSPESDQPTALLLHGDALYLLGSTAGALEPGSHRGETDGFVARYGTDGDRAWLEQFGTPLAEEIHAGAPAEDGGIYVAGATLGVLEGASVGEADALVARFAPDGGLVWARQFGTEQADVLTTIHRAEGGALIASGATFGDLDAPRSTPDDLDLLVALLEEDAEPRWLDEFGTEANEAPFASAVAGPGLLILAGGTRGDLGGANEGEVDAFHLPYRW